MHPTLIILISVIIIYGFAYYIDRKREKKIIKNSLLVPTILVIISLFVRIPKIPNTAFILIIIILYVAYDNFIMTRKREQNKTNDNKDIDSIQNNWSSEEIETFVNNLKQVIDWTQKLAKDFDYEKGKYGFVFRQTNPIFKGQPLYKYGIQQTEDLQLESERNLEDDYAYWSDCNSNADDYDFLLEEAIKRRDAIFPEPKNLSQLGRILIFQTNISTHDGAPIVESNYFVDESDVPPIDTWFFLKRIKHSGFGTEDQSLFCWIPKEFEAVIQQAIEVEILNSYSWFDEAGPLLYEYIENTYFD